MRMLQFHPGPVTVITTLVYIGLVVSLLFVHVTVPHEADLASVDAGTTTDLSEAWHDLQTLTRHYHPYNSHNNDDVRRWLLRRVGEILDGNRAAHKIVSGADAGGAPRPNLQAEARESLAPGGLSGGELAAVVFNDTVSTVTWVARNGNSVYFEGDNIAVYLRGTEDPAGDWWTKPARSYGKGGVLVSAHFDSYVLAPVLCSFIFF